MYYVKYWHFGMNLFIDVMRNESFVWNLLHSWVQSDKTQIDQQIELLNMIRSFVPFYDDEMLELNEKKKRNSISKIIYC